MSGIIVDLSSNNGHPIDYQAAKNAGVIAAFVKATDGTGYTNPFYAQDAAGFASVGVPVLAYHFAQFGNAQAEAAHFLAVAGARARVLDSEMNADVAWQNAFLAALNLPANEELDYGSASSLPRAGIRAFLWVASYGRNYGFGDAWQYTDAQSVPGIPGLVDASVWIGPQADFDSLFSTTSPVPTSSSPQPQGVFMIPTGCTDVNAVRAQMREWWATYRTDPMTTGAGPFFDFFWKLPQDQTAWGKPGWAGNPDLALAWLIDDASTTSHLRPQFVGSV
jgi:hypothetical protein